MSDLKETWIKVIEYASKPHVGISRKLRPGYSLEIDCCGTVYEGEVIFEIYDTYLRISTQEGEKMSNSYFDWEKIGSIKTINKI